MNPEELMRKGRIAEAKKRITELNIEASAHIVQIRMLADPYEENMLCIQSEALLFAATKLNDCIANIRATTKTLDNLEL